jgi:hypothetical protein
LTVPSEEAMHIDRRLLGWGVFFILVGALPLAVRGGYLAAEQVSSWPSLWPVLLIGWGLGLILRRTPVDWIGGGVTAVVFGLMAGGALATGFRGVPTFGGCGGDGLGTAFAAQRGTLATGGQLNVEFNCGTITIAAAEGSEWTVAGSDARGRGPRVEANGTQVSIGTPDGNFFQDSGRNTWTVGVPTAAEFGFGVTLNAGQGTADLTGASVTSASLTVNAGSFQLDLANAVQVGDVNATVNAGDGTISLPAGDRSANFSLNAGSLEACLPAGAPVRVRWSGALGSNDLDESGLTEVDDNTWVSAGFDETAAHLELRVSANAGSFDLTIGGVCGA